MAMDTELRPRITVVGVGGAGGNAVNNMIRAKLEGVEFVVANTDAQALAQSLVPPDHRIQLGLGVTQGLGAGSKPDVGRSAAEESHEEIIGLIKGSNMVFITAGMGGGTGTGAAPVIARAARELGVLTVGVITKPFHFEGSHRTRTADKGIDELQQYVDTLIIIPNQNLFRIANERTTFADAFKMADDVLYSGVRGVTDLMIMPGLINLDFADIRAVMAEMGKAMMGTGEAQGDRRALDAAEAAISNPLLDDVSMKGARGVLINITGGFDMTLYEVDEAANRIRDEVDPDANIIFGSTFDEKLNGTMRVSVVATGIGDFKPSHANLSASQAAPKSEPEKAQTPSFGGSNFASRDFGFGVSSFTPPKTTETEIAASAETILSSPSQSVPSQESFQQTLNSTPEAVSHAQSHGSTVAEESKTVDMLNDIVADLGKTLDKVDAVSSAPSQELSEAPQAPKIHPSPIEVPPASEKKKPISLFERFTGVARGRAAVEEEETLAKKSTPIISAADKHADEDSDVLEIPAFLRREG
ncbi:cell division protein FtsZ [Candidatus Odyssella acanthamoebae]|uniref:Cell division protein FtsZ n=1 Tax=Candidatus Odyssella acanthamoebae TaxID=91604 RepID=A0A077AT70_9PROT|nr:cell division protein FtsZ [Candidatus Paracaedibacter acanthamoebae]AIK95571.1 cell division protein FtsZ [Candidatus Paracaedibacter acanthamoebae]